MYKFSIESSLSYIRNFEQINPIDCSGPKKSGIHVSPAKDQEDRVREYFILYKLSYVDLLAF